MKDIPIYILNKDRLVPPTQLIESLVNRGYYNIVIMDNASTYPELLEWYNQIDNGLYDGSVSVYPTPLESRRDNSVLYWMASLGVNPFYSDTKNKWYVYSDSDVVPVDELPCDFIEHMIEMAQTLNFSKLGWSFKIDDIPDHFKLKELVLQHEGGKFWNNPVDYHINGNTIKIYPANLDTTFAVHAPGFPAKWAPAGTAARVGFPYQARHMPWYYDSDNLPPDEKYYMEHVTPNIGYGWTDKLKNMGVK
tara:strand:+ start:10510 stop:11256 length:747 start_codon:yes stop_codon:yes gene_type:complete